MPAPISSRGRCSGVPSYRSRRDHARRVAGLKHRIGRTQCAPTGALRALRLGVRYFFPVAAVHARSGVRGQKSTAVRSQWSVGSGRSKPSPRDMRSRFRGDYLLSTASGGDPSPALRTSRRLAFSVSARTWQGSRRLSKHGRAQAQPADSVHRACRDTSRLHSPIGCYRGMGAPS